MKAWIGALALLSAAPLGAEQTIFAPMRNGVEIVCADVPEIDAATADLERVFAMDPPAVFLAWQTMSRAVSAKFTVPNQPGRDIMYSIWQWKPVESSQFAER